MMGRHSVGCGKMPPKTKLQWAELTWCEVGRVQGAGVGTSVD